MTAKRPLHRWLKGSLIGAGALVLSTVAINAADLSRDITSLLTGSVIESKGPCGDGALLERFGSYGLCVDVFEAAPGADCPNANPANELETAGNVATPGCAPISEAKRHVWRHVTYTEARQLCARVGKRLPTAEEWYRLALPLAVPVGCVLAHNGPQTTGASTCTTPSGIHDLVGNVWEWMDDTVQNGRFAERYVPQSGYVELVDDAGIVLKTTETAVSSFGDDYAWTEQVGVRGVLRGGFYQSGSDGGIFSQNLAVSLDFQAAGVGFRCVRDVE